MTVAAVLPPTSEYKAMKGLFDAAVKAKVEVPDAVWDFFGDRPPADGGMEISIPPTAVKSAVGPNSMEYIIDLSKIPSSARKIRVRVEWDV